MIVELSAFTNEGRVRTNNEDSWDIIAASWKAQNKTITVTGSGVLLAVADGMGGTNAGEVASRIAVETFRKEFEGMQTYHNDDNSRLQFLESLIKKAHKNIVTESTRNLDHAGMGTTAVIAWLLDHKAYVAWCGDSRLYVYRLGMPFTPFTDDHSVVWEQVKKGNMNVEQARLSDESNIILQSLGDVQQPPQPESRILPLQQNDRILLCSDGLNSMLSDGEIESLLATSTFNTTSVSKQLVDAANIAGGRDNTTVIVANIVKGQKVASSTHNVRKNRGMSKLNMALLSLCLVLTAGIGYFYFTGNSKPKIPVFSQEEQSLISKLNLEFNAFASQKDNFLKDKQLSICKLEESLQPINIKTLEFTNELGKYGLKISDNKHSILIDSSLIEIRDTFQVKSYKELGNHLQSVKLMLDSTIQEYEKCIQPESHSEETKNQNTDKVDKKRQVKQQKKITVNDEKEAKSQLEQLAKLRWEQVADPKYVNDLDNDGKEFIEDLAIQTKSKIITVYDTYGFKVSNDLKYQGSSPSAKPIPNSSFDEIKNFIKQAHQKIINSNN